MSAPTPTARGTPSGIMLRDGYQSLITLSGRTTVSFWEKMVTPPGVDAGEPVVQTTMHNARYRTKRPRQLIDITPVSAEVAYDPDVLNTALSFVGEECTVTVEFYDGSTICFFGAVRSFVPKQVQEGQQPEATITIDPTNWDYVGKVEAGPVITSVSGT